MTHIELVVAYEAAKNRTIDTYSVHEYAGLMMTILGVDTAIEACTQRQPWMSDDDWNFRKQVGEVITRAQEAQA